MVLAPLYLEEVIEEVWSCDALAIVAKGLGAQRVLTELIARSCELTGQGVVLCLNVPREREAGICSTLRRRGVEEMPIFASAETHSRERRRRLYAAACNDRVVVVCTSCRVAIVDLLDSTLEASSVRGVVVAEAHRASEGSAEGFVIRAYRNRNWHGWVRAVSDEAEQFTRGFSKVTKVMKELELERLSLWPRFEARVARCLEHRPVRVIELRRRPSGTRRRLQNAAVVALESCLQELRQASAGLFVCAGADGVNEKTPLAACDAAIRSTLFVDGVPPKARVLAVELKSLRDLVEAVPRYDAVALYDMALSARDSALKGSSSARRRPTSAWARGVALDELIIAARACVYDVSRDKTELTRVLEENVKWRLVADALRNDDDNPPHKRVVVLTRDEHAATGLRDYLSRGGVATMESKFLRFLKRHNARARTLPAPRRTPDQALLLAQEAMLERVYEEGGADQQLSGDDDSQQADGRAVLIATRAQWRARDDALGEWLPDAVVLVDAAPEFVREVEAYSARRAQATTLYILVCDESADDARYAAELAAETEAFEKLVAERRLALVPSSASRAAQREADARRQEELAAKNKQRPSIVVDSREFRSHLPSALHAKGVQLQPATLVVGDYVLSPDLVIERKSLTDLVGSLQSGRLYTQVDAMLRYYAMPVLLVETTSSFFGSWRPHNEETSTTSQTSQRAEHLIDDELPPPTSNEARFALLAMTYPRLRVVWSRDVDATVTIFAGLKRGRLQPSLEVARDQAAASGSEQDDGGGRNLCAIDLLLKLPGVNDKNVTEIIENVDSLCDLSHLDKHTLAPLVGPANAKLLYDFFHEVDTTALPIPDHSSLLNHRTPPLSEKSASRKYPKKAHLNDMLSLSPYFETSQASASRHDRKQRRHAAAASSGQESGLSSDSAASRPEKQRRVGAGPSPDTLP